MGTALDHVIVRVDDLAAAGREFEARYGLASVAGGRHPGWGTANRIVPLGSSYLELVAVIEPAAAITNPFGRWVAGHPPGAPLGWVVGTDDLDAAARRLGLTIGTGSRATPEGGRLEWRSAGLSEAAAEPCLPFFIEWAPGSLHPGAIPAAHRAGGARLSALTLRGDPGRLAGWLGEHTLPISVERGEPAVLGVTVATDAGAVQIGAA
jgi:hypothetical protein